MYGASIQSLYTNIYTSFSPTTPVSKTTTADNYYSGNYPYPVSLYYSLYSSGEYISPSPRCSVTNYRAKILSGTNTYTLSRITNKKWVIISLAGGWGTGGVNLSNFKLIFGDSSQLTIQQAINQKYIEPLSIISARSTESQYVWKNFYTMLNGGQTDTVSNPHGTIIIKMTGKSALTGCQFTSSRDFENQHDGLEVIELPENVKISTQPLG